jgi:hypothetical protein
MQSIDIRGLDKIDAALNNLLKKAPEMRRKLHEEIAYYAQKAVVREAGMTTERHTGNLQRWQEKYVGSGGGYAAVRPIDTSTGDESPGAITNYVNSGHKIRSPWDGARPRRTKVAYVDGRHFYQSAARDMEDVLVPLAEEFVRDMAGILEGK